MIDETLTARAESLLSQGFGRVYVAGPMTGLPEFNYPAFEAAARDLRALGFDVSNPVEIDHAAGHDVNRDGPQSHRDYMRRDLPEVLSCDAVVVLPGWENSKGARIEVGVAVECGLGVFDASLVDVWIDGEFFPPAAFDPPAVCAPSDLCDPGGCAPCRAVADAGGDPMTATSLPPLTDCDPGDENDRVFVGFDVSRDDTSAACVAGRSLDGIVYIDEVVHMPTEALADMVARWNPSPSPSSGFFSFSTADERGDGGEVRATSETGGEKGRKPEQFSAMPWEAISELATHYGVGAAKYAAHNYRKGYPWSWSFDAMMRHAAAFWTGEDLDPETKTKHVLAIAFHALALSVFMDDHPALDDRPHVTLAEAAA